MTVKYDLLNGNKRHDYIDSVNKSARAVVGIIRYKNKHTYDFSKSQSFIESDPSAEYDDVLIIDKLIGVSTSASKGSHVGTADVTCKDDTSEIMSTVAPGDWMMIWICNNQEDAHAARGALTLKSAANGPMSGLKFVGRVSGIRKNISVDEYGTKTKIIFIQGRSFGEIDSEIFYDSTLVENDTANNWLWSLSQNREDLFGLAQQSAAIDPTASNINQAFPILLTVLLGAGPTEASAAPSPLLARSPNQAYIIPKTVYQLLGGLESNVAGNSFDVHRDRGQVPFPVQYRDILQIIMGIQSYDASTGGSGNFTSSVHAKRSQSDFLDMLPAIDTDKSINGNFWFTPLELTGAFNPQIQPWSGVPVWQILYGYLNPVINEMYTTLKVGFDNTIMPHLIVRQKPFASIDYADQLDDSKATTFFSLPRWVIAPELILNEDVGRSDSLRANYVLVLPTIPNGTQANQEQDARSQAAQTIDIDDIKRNGLRRSWNNVNALQDDVVGTGIGPESPYFKWSKLTADRLMDGHLRFTGTLSLVGIQEPISEGDNVEYNGVVYHIENISHQYQEDSGTGQTFFATTLQVVNGLNAEQNMNSAWPELEQESSP